MHLIFGLIMTAWSFSSFHGEMDGIIKTIEVSKEMKIIRLQFSSDIKDLVDFFPIEIYHSLPSLEGKKDSILSILSSFESWSISYIPRSSNFLAHNIAKWVISCNHARPITIFDLPSNLRLHKAE